METLCAGVVRTGLCAGLCAPGLCARFVRQGCAPGLCVWKVLGRFWGSFLNRCVTTGDYGSSGSSKSSIYQGKCMKQYKN